MFIVWAPVEFKPGVPDYSSVHEPLGELFDPITSPGDWKKYLLSEEKVEQFWKDGFLLNVPLLSPEQCDRILEDYKIFMGEITHPGMDMMYEYHSNQSGDPNNVLIHGLGHWRLTKLFHDLVFLPQAVVPSSQLLVKGKSLPVRFWHDQLFAKPPHHGGCVAWHQDYSYWTRTQPVQHITIHIALEDQTKENGTLYYIPGSHRWTRDGKPLPVTDFNFKDMESIMTVLTEEEKKEFKPIPSLLKKGEASFHTGMAVHGSYGNKSASPRRSAVLNYFADGTISNTDEDLLKGIKIPKGEKMDGQFFPLLFDPKWME